MLGYAFTSGQADWTVLVRPVSSGTTNKLRGYILGPSGLTVACTRFPPEVQINLILKACLSGSFSKAFRVLG